MNIKDSNARFNFNINTLYSKKFNAKEKKKNKSILRNGYERWHLVVCIMLDLAQYDYNSVTTVSILWLENLHQNAKHLFTNSTKFRES